MNDNKKSHWEYIYEVKTPEEVSWTQEKPETSLNEDTLEQYDKNIFHCTRQVHYSLSSENSIDIVLLLNGIPVVSMELKCQFTGQTAMNAINQYKFDRASKDKIFEFRNHI